MYKIILIPLFVLLLNHSALAKEKSFYCIQVLTTDKLTDSEYKLFTYMSKLFPSVRIEKIGKFYTLRIGFWQEIRQAKFFLKKLHNLGMKKVLLRKCYLIPKRWIYPSGSLKIRKKVFIVKENKRKVERKDYSKLIRKIWASCKFKEDLSYEKIDFPAARTKNRQKFVRYIMRISVNRDYKNLYNYQLLSFNNVLYLGVYSINRKFRPYIGFDNLHKKFQLNEFMYLDTGIEHRKNDIEDWYPLTFELGTDFVDTNFLFSVSYVPFRNYNNEVNLKKLLYSNVSLLYLLLRQYKLTVEDGYIKFTNGKKRGFYAGNFLKFSLKTPTLLSSLLLGKKSLSWSFLKSYDKCSLYVSFNKNFKAIPMRYGRIYTTEDLKYPFIVDDFNLTKVFFFLKRRKIDLSVGSYYVNDLRKPVFIGLNEYKVNSRFLGISLGIKFKNLWKRLHVYGDVFFPTSAFKDRSVKFAGGINYQKDW